MKLGRNLPFISHDYHQGNSRFKWLELIRRHQSFSEVSNPCAKYGLRDILADRRTSR